MNAQSVKTSANVAETSQGIDAGKKIKGRKRHLTTDTLGLVPAAATTSAPPTPALGGPGVRVAGLDEPTAVRYTIPSGVTILDLKYRESGYDTDFPGSFTSNDAFLNTLSTPGPTPSASRPSRS
ncbi:hypothetical protein OHT76_42210 [Streptomyces sp. NBC_00287]|uniref:hypothetical protein n=1 Tax=Streptomyces sp. NBC_00287 TaxID=2975702 RepID=UPI002E2A073D|nr:hypothetical protein [Streptomyces sp. NBC_00287]